MSITNFEEHTAELSPFESSTILPMLIKGFKTKNKATAIKAHEIISKLNSSLLLTGITYKLTGQRLRKMCNYIRSEGLLPLIATSRGYYISNDKAEILAQKESMMQRAQSIIRAAEGLDKFI